MMALRASLGLLLALGSSGPNAAGGGTVPAALSASLAPSATAGAKDLVRLRGGRTSGDLMDVEVVLRGPTTSRDLYSVAFDLAIADPGIVRLDHATAGGALNVHAGQTRSVQASMAGDRIVVGVSKLGGGAGNGVSAEEAVLVTLTLKVLKAGATTVSFAGAPSASGPARGPAALDSSGRVVPSVRFDPSSAHVTAH